MCSEGSVSARDSFVYISEAVLSNHGDAPDDAFPKHTLELSEGICMLF